MSISQETIVLPLGGNRLSGPLPSNLSSLSVLEHLDLRDNNLTGELPESLSQISTLQILNLRNNSLQGSIPETISNLSSLRILDVSNNNLTGKIPKECGNLVGMVEIPNLLSSISDLFTFSIEFKDLIVNWKKSKQGLSIRNLDIYTLLDLSKNQLSGEIPASLGALKALKLLNVSYNKLSGKIPDSFGDLENVESLDFSHNQLSGSIPQTLVKLNQLGNLDVSNNQLKGRIPVGGQMNSMADPIYYANNSGLCGMQIHVACPEDQPPPPPPGGSAVHDTKDPWFIWEGVGIGYPIGFLFAVGIIFLTGYFTPPPSTNHRYHRRQRQSIRRRI